MKLLDGTYGGKLRTPLYGFWVLEVHLPTPGFGETWDLFCILIWEKNDSWSLFF